MPDTSFERIDQRTAVVRPGIEVDVQHAAAIRDTFIGLHADGVVRYVVDMAAVEMVDSTGLSVLFRAWRRAVHNGGGLTLAAPSDRIRKALAAADCPARLHDDVKAALHSTTAKVG
jgi:stage II sporulation protein AA (anti-sigma F factor antagonist)